MKNTKKILCLLLSGLLVLSCGGCGKKSQTAVLTYEQNGVTIEYQFESKKDVIEKITQVTTTSGATDMSASASSYQALYSSIEGVTYSTEIVENSFVETITIDATNAATLQTLAAQGLLQLDGAADALSFQKTVDNLTAQGWAIQED